MDTFGTVTVIITAFNLEGTICVHRTMLACVRHLKHFVNLFWYLLPLPSASPHLAPVTHCRSKHIYEMPIMSPHLVTDNRPLVCFVSTTYQGISALSNQK